MNKKILIIDNYDSFTYNLVQIIRESSEHEFDVIRNDEIDLKDAGKYGAFIFSPGPGVPIDAGIMMDIINTYKSSHPMFGVCLGMQAIGQAFGGELYNLEQPLHGISTLIELSEDVMFDQLPLKVTVGRYHSWAVKAESLPKDLLITAKDDLDTAMALRHKSLPISAVQFHPESILSEYGSQIVINFLKQL